MTLDDLVGETRVHDFNRDGAEKCKSFFRVGIYVYNISCIITFGGSRVDGGVNVTFYVTV